MGNNRVVVDRNNAYMDMRVIVDGTYDSLKIKNKTGKIVQYNPFKEKLLIKFDEKFSDRLHNEGGLCWYIPYDIKIVYFEKDYFVIEI